ncbi:MAG: FG-GAP-like repeat-containing protein, partial [Chryseolinea sp.]
LYEVEAGDLNNDGKVDVVGYGDFAGNAISFRNTHTSGNISLSSLLADDTITSVPYPRLFDLDGDGLMDMITASGSCRNVSVGSEIKFNTYAYISPGGYFYNDFADFNNDGKIDIVGINTTNVSVNENRTTTGDFITTIPFATFSDSYYFTKPASGGATVAADFDNDGLMDFAVSNPGSNNVSVWKNNGAYRISITQFTAQPNIAVGNNPDRIYKGDFDVDGKVDLMLYYGTGTSSTLISVLHNESTVGNIVFTRFDFTIPALATIAHVSDLDGDGKPDILITSETTDQFFILKNTSTAGVINASSFAAPFIMAVNNPRGITTADLNLDGKPDIVITSAPNSLLVFENLIPTGPSITINPQPSSTAVCSGTNTSFSLTATGTTNLIYQWQKFDGSVFNAITNTGGYSGTTTATLSINTTGNFGAGDYRCMVSGDGASAVFSATVTLTLTTSTTVAEITVNGNTLTASPGDSYQWYQNGDEVSGATNQSYELNILEYGMYVVDVTDNGCTSTSLPFEYLITGLENFGSELKVYPNPIDKDLLVEFEPPYNLIVVDITGKIVHQVNVKTKSIRIDLSALSKGMYLLRIQNDDATHYFRIAKE